MIITVLLIVIQLACLGVVARLCFAIGWHRCQAWHATTLHKLLDGPEEGINGMKICRAWLDEMVREPEYKALLPWKEKELV